MESYEVLMPGEGDEESAPILTLVRGECAEVIEAILKPRAVVLRLSDGGERLLAPLPAQAQEAALIWSRRGEILVIELDMDGGVARAANVPWRVGA